jgi:hypothetical protein
MRETIKNLCVLLVIGYALYKIYEKFFKGSDLLDMSEFEDNTDSDLEAIAEESLSDRIKRAAGRTFSKFEDEF